VACTLCLTPFKLNWDLPANGFKKPNLGNPFLERSWHLGEDIGS
jgi:hypothetical protein